MESAPTGRAVKKCTYFQSYSKKAKKRHTRNFLLLFVVCIVEWCYECATTYLHHHTKYDIMNQEVIVMKKTMRILLIALIAVIVLPIALYSGIVITNNCIADRIEKRLTAYELPEGTELVDSVSTAGKFNGNGNGMQYIGTIVVSSDLREDELKDYYSSVFDYIEVTKESNDNCYSIICMDDDRREIFGDFIVFLLDFDIRGHWKNVTDVS